MKKRVVISGLGVVSSIGIGKDAFWESLICGKSGISEVSSFDTSKHATHVGGEIKHFKPQNFMRKNRARYIGRASQLAVAATRLALEDAGLKRREVSDARTAVCLGTTMGEIQAVEKADQAWIRSGKKEVEKWPLYQGSMHNIPSNVAMEFKLRGRIRIFTTACASGNYAIGYGYDLLKAGDADLVFAGGTDAFSWIAFTGFNKIGAAAPERCQPFDKNRKGMIPAEGAGILVLETLDNALKRGARIYAEILGYGLSCDAFHMTNPQVEGVARCMRNALEESGVTAGEVGYISAHGTGTIFNDRTESQAINEVFGRRRVPVSSIKSMLGHTMGAASAIETIACSLIIHSGFIPPTLNFETPDPDCDIDCVPNNARMQEVRVAINNGFAFGGNNACLVLKKPDTGKQEG